MTTEAPKRASASFTITMGLLSIPLNVYSGTEAVTISRSQFLADGRSVGTHPCVKLDDGSYGDKVDKTEIVKRYQTTSGLVELTDAEIDACSTSVPGTADVIAVHSMDLLRNGDYVPNGKVWQVRAAGLGSGKTKKANPGGEQALVLLLTALREKNSFMLLRWSREGSVYSSALLPSGRLVGLWHDEEIRADRDLPFSDHTFRPEEVAMAGMLLGAFESAEPVPLVNETVAAVSAYAEAKAKDPASVLTTAVAAAAAPTAAVDMMAQLRASVEAVAAERGTSVPAATITLVEQPTPASAAPKKRVRKAAPKVVEKVPA